MNSVNHSELKEQIHISYQTKTPLFIWGGVGIGKSETIRSCAKEISKEMDLEFSEVNTENGHFGFLDVRISQLEPSDLRGLPVQDLNNETTRWLIPNWLPKKEDSKGIIFFDELNLSPPSIQAVAYQLILDRRIGDYVLPKGWVILSAGNRVEDKCSVFEMSNALCNRFSHAELTPPDKDEWSKWAMENDVDSRIIAFINFKPSSLNRVDDKNMDKAFPTPRSWKFCSQLISQREDLKLVKRLVSGSVGEGTSIEFVAFLKLQSKINLKEILKNPKSIENVKEIDLRYVLLGTIAETYKKDKKILSQTFELCDYLEPEFSILLLRFLKAIDEKNFAKGITSNKKGQELLKRYAEILA
jgi:hypothetical protein